MEKFNYDVEFYKRNIFTIEELIERKNESSNAIYVEECLSKLNSNVDLIRENILISYSLNKNLSKEERLYYVKGVIYARQYLNEEDLDTFLNIITSDKKENLERSVFSLRPFTDSHDKNFYKNFAKVLSTGFNKLGEYESLNPEEGEEETDTNNIDEESVELKENEDEDVEEEEEEEKYYNNLKTLSPIKRIELLDKYFPIYLNGILKYKNVKNKIEYQMIKKGAYRYFNYMKNIFYDAYEFILEEKKRNSKNLLLTI